MGCIAVVKVIEGNHANWMNLSCKGLGYHVMPLDAGCNTWVRHGVSTREHA